MLTIPCPHCGQPIPLYTMEDAAGYLGLSLSALKYHVHLADNLTPAKLGNTLVFTQAQLDEFQASRRPQGRPKPTEEV